jgi:ureidoglycolate hydrolase
MSIEIYQCQELSDFPARCGQVIQCPNNEATFHSDIFSYWDGIASFQINGEAGIGWFELKRRPFTGNEVERHRLSPEALLCIQGGAICFVGEPADPEKIGDQGFGAFYVEQGKGFIFSPGTWHAIPFPVTEKAVFGVIFRKGTAQNDLEVLNLEQEKGFRFQISMSDQCKG